ncbi:MAG: ATP-binding protein, partial [Methylococcales bacterium]
MSRIQLGSDDFIALYDTDLRLITHYPSPSNIQVPTGDNSQLSQPLTAALKTNPNVGIYVATSIDAISHTHSYRRNPKYGFIINVGVANKSALAEWRKQVWIIAALVSLFVISLLLFSRLIKQSWLSQEHDMELLKINQQALYDAQRLAKLGNYHYDISHDLWTSSSILDDILGIPRDYLRDTTHWLALVVPESHQNMADYLKFIIEQHLAFDCEYRIIRPNDNQQRWVHGKGRLQFDAQGKPSHLVGTIQDITARKLIELELYNINNELEIRVQQRTGELEIANQSLTIAKEAAEAANIAKSTFIATMSHELRTPLNAILGFSELMSQDSSSTPAQKETLAIINRSGEHLLSMINDVLDISKIEAGHFELTTETCDLVKLLDDIGTMVGVRASTKKLSFRVEIADGITRYVSVDSGKLRQILINLLGNAIKFTQQGGVILRAGTRPLTEAMVMLGIEIVDSGMGIPADQQAELFKPFVQLTQKNSEVKGTGLGLAISKSLVELMGGQLSVSSNMGVGSVFTIKLPLAIASANGLVVQEIGLPVKCLAPNQPAWRLLIVDDNADNRLLLNTLLKTVGFDVREAEDGQQAIIAFKQWQPHLIWMDMRMPVMDG